MTTHILKYIIIGDTNVGKSSILNRYLFNNFNNYLLPTIGVELSIKNITYKNIKFKLNIWDISGNSNFKAITINYFRNANGILLVFDKNNKKSFDNLKSWYKLLTENYNIDNKNKFQPTIILVGSKYDQEQFEVNEKDIEDFMKGKKIFKYIDCSSKDGYNINYIFDVLNESVIENMIKFNLIRINKINHTGENEEKKKTHDSCIIS